MFWCPFLQDSVVNEERMRQVGWRQCFVFFQCLDSCLLNNIKWRQSCSGWVEIFQFSVGWVGLGWVSQLMGWVGSGYIKWTHGQLWGAQLECKICSDCLPRFSFWEPRRKWHQKKSSVKQRLNVYMCVFNRLSIFKQLNVFMHLVVWVSLHFFVAYSGFVRCHSQLFQK